MIHIRKLGCLAISAASGIAWDGTILYAIADDELFLDGYDEECRLVCRVPLLPGRLGDGPGERKRTKPDFEALCRLPGGRLLVLPSGSSPLRSTAVLLDGMEGGMTPQGPARAIDVAPLHALLRERFVDLNLEGAAVVGDRLRLLHRGNTTRPENAVIDLALDATLRRLDEASPLDGSLVAAVRSVDLGSLDGIPLGFTDAAPLGPDTSLMAFVAAAEDSLHPIEDGPCTGSVLGLLDEEGHVVWSERIEGLWKFEGLAVDRQRGMRLAEDPDDRARPSVLYGADWPW